MKKSICLALLLMLFVVMAIDAQAAVRPKVWILIDLSNSPLHVTSEEFCAKMADYVDRHVFPGLPLGSTITIKSFGEYDRSKNLVSLDFILRKKPGQRPQDVRNTIKLLLSKLPVILQKGNLSLQQMTCLIGELKVMGQRFDPNQENTVIIISDLLEFSSEANAYQLVTQKKGGLPKAPANLLKNAKVIALGAGVGVRNSRQNDRLQAMWTQWFMEAGAKEFKYLSDF